MSGADNNRRTIIMTDGNNKGKIITTWPEWFKESVNI